MACIETTVLLINEGTQIPLSLSWGVSSVIANRGVLLVDGWV